MIRVIVGVVPRQVLTHEDYGLLKRVEQSELTTLEYVMALWEMLGTNDREHCYQYVIEGLDTARPQALRYQDEGLHEDDPGTWDALAELEETASKLVDLLLRLYHAYYPALHNLPYGQGEMDGPLETVTVDSIHTTFTVLNFFFTNDEGYYRSPTGYSTYAAPSWVSGQVIDGGPTTYEYVNDPTLAKDKWVVTGRLPKSL